MAVTSDDFASVGASLRNAAKSEIDLRTSANRAYYATYHHVVKFADQLSLPIGCAEAGGSHAREYGRLIDCRADQHPDFFRIRQLGYKARGKMRPWRVHADYVLGDEFTDEHADVMISESIEVIAELKALIGSA